MNYLGQIQYMPLMLILLENNYSKDLELKIDTIKYKRIDPRLIFITEYDEQKPKKIESILIRFCSIHNELGDRFTVGKGDKAEDYDLINDYFPFNINIACIGRFGQGKSTGVNQILNEYKAKESSKGSSQTRELTFYQVSRQPIRILDIPGFESPYTLKKAIEKFKICGEKINKIKDNLHIILYFIKYSEDRKFMQLEYSILEEIYKHPSSKIIYVITQSNPNMDDIDKEEEITRINEGMQGITEDIKNGFEPFGKRELFKKIYDIFIQSEDYINSNKSIDSNIIEQQAKKLRLEAEDIII